MTLVLERRVSGGRATDQGTRKGAVLTDVGTVGGVREAWASAWDRIIASDPAFSRLLGALRIVLAVVLSIGVMAALHTTVPLIVTGATAAEVFSFAVSDPRPRDQAVTLALGLPTGLATLALGSLVAHQRLLSDLACVAVIFAAVYVRRFGRRPTGLGVIAFQMFFITLFVGPRPHWLSQVCVPLVIAWACSAVVRFGIVRASPQPTLLRLREAFRARLLQLIDALIDVVEVAERQPGTLPAEGAIRRLQRRTARLHQAALMIQAHLDESIRDARSFAHVQRRVAEAEVGAERLAVVLLRALGFLGANPVAGDMTERLSGAPPVDAIPLRTADRKVVRRVIADLKALRLIAGHPGIPVGVGLRIVRDRLLGYRDDERLPHAPAPVQDVFRAIGDLSLALLGLRMALAEPEEGPDDSPEIVRSREELQAEEEVLEAEDAVRAAREETDEPTGLRRTTTRLAVQVALASALAILGGELLSPRRWYWAVFTCWVAFVNVSSSGEILVKGYRRLVGTLLGVLAGIGLAYLVGIHHWLAFALVTLCLFGTFYTAAVSYALVSFFVTAMIGLLYTLLGTFTPDLLFTRLVESALGVACAMLAGLLVLPVPTQRRAEEQIRDVLERLREVTGRGVAELQGGRPVDLVNRSRALDSALNDLRTTTQPLRHPINPLRRRRRITRYILGLLETAAYHARSLAAIAQQTLGTPAIRQDPRLVEMAGRVDRNLDALITCMETDGGCREPLDVGGSQEPPTAVERETGAEPDGRPRKGERPDAVTSVALRHLQRVDEDVLGLARPLGVGLKQERPEHEPDARSEASAGTHRR
ncbi:FUSC family protein [Streptomyces sp. RB6PN25]|uniref:FUSC family protein n=1 Tax=Streptomyces humicola TaxID=2953240 RepID=A0ABT1Q296_9ACTN|nr:FUSC family protein [Streptomyces humicola]MCQ4084062.1 FUSC family protein [Streptomyces humicola]